MRRTLLTIIMLVLAPSLARAQGTIMLRWNACYGDGGSEIKTFACDTNSGTETLVVSARPGVDLYQFNGASCSIVVLSLDPTLPNWWQLQAGGCRPGSITMDLVPPLTSSACTAPWQGATVGGMVFNYPLSYIPGLDPGRIRIVAATPATLVSAGQELFLFTIGISRSMSAGTGACSGCESAACLGLVGVTLTQPNGEGDLTLQPPEPGTNSDMVTWQSGAVMRRWYDPNPGSLPFKYFQCLSVTDVERPTWGAIKRLYRR